MQTRTYSAPIVVLCVGWMTLACSDQTYSPRNPVPTQPSAPAPAPIPAPAVVRDITLGEMVHDKVDETNTPCTTRYNWPVPCRQYRLTAPADGTLVAKLTWDPWRNGVILMLRVEEQDINPPGAPWSPVVARLKVIKGQSYRLAVGLAGQDWFGGDQFTLITEIE
jgi:hypothetical protein